MQDAVTLINGTLINVQGTEQWPFVSQVKAVIRQLRVDENRKPFHLFRVSHTTLHLVHLGANSGK